MEVIIRFPASLVREQIEAVLRGWGMTERNVATSAEVMIETDLMGVDSHGISMLMLYDVMNQAGQINVAAEPRIVRESATTALIDGAAGLGHPAAVLGMKLAIEKALRSDIGAVSVFNSHHYGAAGYYAQMAAERGLIAMVTSSTRLVTLVPTLGAQAVLGTNPFAFAAPAGRQPPVILDIATSVVAANKVKVYALQGKDIPQGWVVDGSGAPVTDSAEAYRLLFERFEGGLAPIGGDGTTLGGHKGYGLAVFAQIFSSTLGGGSFSPVRNRTQRSSDPDNIGHFFLALNPAAFRPLEDFYADMDELVETLHATKPADPARPVLMPGDPERLSRAERLAGGIPLPRSLLDRLQTIALSAGAPFLLKADHVMAD
ncbi:MAG: Ldh family oxidoreductase [Pseudomonadota bacterium]|nr:Ldh family oxidoreductase [Pseudomonadota bacterium]